MIDRFIVEADSSCMYNLSGVDQIHSFRQSSDGGKFKLITYDHGGSTDNYPRYELVLVFEKTSEMSNTWFCFPLGQFYEVNDIKRISAGIYAIQVKSPIDYPTCDSCEGRFLMKIDTINVWQDEGSFVGSFDDFDFADGFIASSIEVTILKPKNN